MVFLVVQMIQEEVDEVLNPPFFKFLLDEGGQFVDGEEQEPKESQKTYSWEGNWNSSCHTEGKGSIKNQEMRNYTFFINYN